MKNKKIASFLLAVLVLVASSLSTLAAAPTDNLVSPCYIQMDDLGAAITFSGSNATAKVTISTQSNCTVKVTLAIQTLASTGWTDYVTFSTQTVSTSASAPKSVSNATSYIPDGWYRTSAYIEVYQNGVFIESDTITSPMKYKG